MERNLVKLVCYLMRIDERSGKAAVDKALQLHPKLNKAVRWVDGKAWACDRDAAVFACVVLGEVSHLYRGSILELLGFGQDIVPEAVRAFLDMAASPIFNFVHIPNKDLAHLPMLAFGGLPPSMRFAEFRLLLVSHEGFLCCAVHPHKDMAMGYAWFVGPDCAKAAKARLQTVNLSPTTPVPLSIWYHSCWDLHPDIEPPPAWR